MHVQIEHQLSKNHWFDLMWYYFLWNNIWCEKCMINAVNTSNTFYMTAKQNLIQVYNKSLKYHLFYSDRFWVQCVSATYLYGKCSVSQLYFTTELYGLKSNRVGIKYLRRCEIGINVLFWLEALIAAFIRFAFYIALIGYCKGRIVNKTF